MENMATLNLTTGLHTRLEMDAIPEAIIEAGSAVRTIARKLGLGSHTTNKLVRAVCEVVLNSCTYAYPADAGKVIVEITCDDNCINVEVVDFGRGFNCGDYFRPDGSRGPRAQPHTGLFIAAEAVDRMTIESNGTGTIVRMTKKV